MSRAKTQSGRGVVSGLLLLSLGILLTLHNFGLLSLGGLRRFWPLLLIGAGLVWVWNRRTRVLGAIMIALGAGLQLSYLGWLRLTLGQVMRYWPLILVAAGLNMLIGTSRRRSWLPGVIVLCLGVALQLQNLGWLWFEVWRLWPVVLILAGVLILRRGWRGRRLGF